MDNVTFKAFLQLIMCSDPWPVLVNLNELDNQAIITNFADNEAERHGYKDWMEAYHKMD